MKVKIYCGLVYWIDDDLQQYLLEDFVWQNKRIACYWMVLK